MADPGWYRDPYDRFEVRWFDGTLWTAQVGREGRAMVDPAGAGISTPSTPPFAPPAATSNTEPVSSSTSTTTINISESLGPDARRRPEPALATSLAAGGGILFTAGVLALLGDSASTAGIIVVSLLVIAGALAVRLGLPKQHHFAHAAAVAAALVAIPVFVIAATNSSLDNGDTTGTLMLITVLYAVAWLAPGFRGRPTILTAALLTFMGTVSSVVGTDSNNSECSFDCNPFEDAVDGFGTWLSAQAWVYLGLAAVFLTAVALLDRRGWQGVATSFAFVSIVATAVGLSLVLSTLNDTGGAMMVLVVGIAVTIVGSRGARRALTWWGAALTTIGAAAFPLITIEPSSTTSTAFLLLIAGAALILVPLGIARIAAAQAEGPPAAEPTLQ